MDFIVKLPKTKNGYDSLVVFVDQFSKAIKVEPMKEMDDAEAIAKIYFRTVFCHHGLPNQIICDHDARFTSRFWQALLKQIKTNIAMSTAYHPQTDGQTEIVN